MSAEPTPRSPRRLAILVTLVNLVASSAALILALSTPSASPEASHEGPREPPSTLELSPEGGRDGARASLSGFGLDLSALSATRSSEEAPSLRLALGRLSGAIALEGPAFDLSAAGLALMGPPDDACPSREKINLSSRGIEVCGQAL